MISAEEVTRLALSLPDARAEPHFDRVAFKARITFATLAPDGRSVNLKFAPEHQAFKVMMAPAGFQPVPGGWGRMGWTVMNLDAATPAEAEAALREAHALAGPKPRSAKSRRRPEA